MTETLSELGYYALSRHPVRPAELVAEAQRAELLGFGTAFVSERFNVKDAAVLSGALAAASSRMGVATAATNHHTRHPIVTATMAATLGELSDGRFALGLGRGIDPLWQVLGLPTVTGAQLEDFAALLRRLWAGETVIGHDGPAGEFPLLNLGITVEPPPILLVTMSPRTLELAGRIADGVVLHPFLTDDATSRAVATVRGAAERAGRDPAEVRIWAVTVTVPDSLGEAERLRRLYGRLATYLQGYPGPLAAANDWPTEALDRVRATDAFTGARGAIDATATEAELAEIAAAVPPAWVADSAVGSPAECAATINHQLELGADSVVLHGAPPSELDEVVETYRRVRRERHLPVNPGVMP